MKLPPWLLVTDRFAASIILFYLFLFLASVVESKVVGIWVGDPTSLQKQNSCSRTVNSYPSVHFDPIPPQPIHCLSNGYSRGGEKPAGSRLSKDVIWSQAHKLAPDGYRALARCLRVPSVDLSVKP